jgi:hypothetical protein
MGFDIQNVQGDTIEMNIDFWHAKSRPETPLVPHAPENSPEEEVFGKYGKTKTRAYSQLSPR